MEGILLRTHTIMLSISSATFSFPSPLDKPLQTLTLRKTKDRCPHSQRRRILWCNESPAVSMSGLARRRSPEFIQILKHEYSSPLDTPCSHTPLRRLTPPTPAHALVVRVPTPLGVLPGSHTSARPRSAYGSHADHVPISPAQEGGISRRPHTCTTQLCLCTARQSHADASFTGGLKIAFGACPHPQHPMGIAMRPPQTCTPQ